MIRGIAAAAVAISTAFCTPAHAFGPQTGELFTADHTVTRSQQEVHCLAMNMYWEARNQSVKGMMAVALVTMNRVADERYPSTVCEVVTQGPTRPSWKDPHKHYPIRHRCQFSWYCDGKSDKLPKVDLEVYEIARVYAYKIYMGHGTPMVHDFTKGATHYHADYVMPEWAEKKKPVLIVGNHIFYRWIQ